THERRIAVLATHKYKRNEQDNGGTAKHNCMIDEVSSSEESYSGSVEARGTAKPEVSVLVPARNEEASLGACLESLIAQQDATFELFVIDDHSTDRTLQLVSSFGAARVIGAVELRPGCGGKA